jgi:small-conductance mechanosensitive channel
MAGELYGILVIFIGVIAALIANAVYKWLQKRADLTESKIDDVFLLAFGKPLVIFILVLSFYIAFHYFFVLPEAYAWILDSRYLIAVYMLIATWIVSSFVHNVIRIYGRWLSERTESDLDDRIIEILEIAAKYIIWFIGILMVLAYLEIQITPLLAGAGVAGLAVALAAQDIISNFFGGAIILVDKPFKVGDRIRINDYVGDVVTIGPRSTRLMTIDSEIVSIPNATITNSVVVNFAQPEAKVKLKIPVSVAYGTSVDLVRKTLLNVAKEAADTTAFVLNDPPPSVYFLEFGESSLNFTLSVWIRTYGVPWEARDAINTLIDRRFAEARIEIPFKQIEVRMRS